MQPGKIHPDWRQWIPCNMIECSGFFAAWPKASWLNAVDSMQRHWMQKTPCIVVQWIPIVFSGDHAVSTNATWVNALDFMQNGPKHPDWMQWIPCSMIKCSGFYAACPKTSRLNAVDTMQHDWMQWILCSMAQMHPDRMQRIPCIVAQWIPIVCSGFHALWLNAVNCMQRGKMHPDWMQWIPSSVIKCSRFHTA